MEEASPPIENKCLFFIHGLSGNGHVQGTAIRKALEKAGSDWKFYRCTYSDGDRATIVKTETRTEDEVLENEDDTFAVLGMLRGGLVQFSDLVYESIVRMHLGAEHEEPAAPDSDSDEYLSIEEEFTTSDEEGDVAHLLGEEMHEIQQQQQQEPPTRSPPITHLALVGSSMGGLIARRVALKLMRGKATVFAGVEFMTLGTVATPHIGVGEQRLFASWKAGVIARFLLGKLSLTARDLLWKTDFLTELADSEHMDALLQFRNRINYLPLRDDDVVSYESCAMLTRRPESFRERLGDAPILEKPYLHEYSAEEWQNVDEERKNAIKHGELIGRVHDDPLWTSVVVNSDHRPLASMYNREDRPLAGPMCEAVARHFVARLG